MSIIPASRLSASELARLGNNISDDQPSSPRRRRRRVVAAVNRSLINFGEQVGTLHQLPIATLAGQRAALATSA